MWIYWAIILLSIFFYSICALYRNKRINILPERAVDKTRIKAYFVVVSVAMILIIGLREYHIGNDTITYYNTYQRMSSKDFSYILSDEFKDETAEKGYLILQILFNKLHFSFTGFNIVYAVFNIWVISLFIYKKSEIAWISYFLYIAFGFFVLDLTMMRQTTAMSIVILAVLYDRGDNVFDFIKFALIVYVASLIHSSAIICIPVWFVFKIPYNKKTLVVFLCLISASYLLKGVMVNIVAYIASNISDKYETAAANLSEGTAGIRQYLMILATVLVGSYLGDFLKDKFNIRMHYMLLIMLIIFPAVQDGGAFMRAYLYFYVFMIIYVPNMIGSIDKKKDKLAYLIILSLYIIVGTGMYISSILGNSYNMVPYEFFWE